MAQSFDDKLFEELAQGFDVINNKLDKILQAIPNNNSTHSPPVTNTQPKRGRPKKQAQDNQTSPDLAIILPPDIQQILNEKKKADEIAKSKTEEPVPGRKAPYNVIVQDISPDGSGEYWITLIDPAKNEMARARISELAPNNVKDIVENYNIKSKSGEPWVWALGNKALEKLQWSDLPQTQEDPE